MKHLSDLLSSTAVVQFTAASDPEIVALQYDSRRVQQGDCFFAVRGTQSDGHNYITSAAKQGAVAVVCEALPEALAEGVSYVVVEDSNKAMADMAAAFYDYPSEELELVGLPDKAKAYKRRPFIQGQQQCGNACAYYVQAQPDYLFIAELHGYKPIHPTAYGHAKKVYPAEACGHIRRHPPVEGKVAYAPQPCRLLQCTI